MTIEQAVVVNEIADVITKKTGYEVSQAYLTDAPSSHDLKFIKDPSEPGIYIPFGVVIHGEQCALVCILEEHGWDGILFTVDGLQIFPTSTNDAMTFGNPADLKQACMDALLAILPVIPHDARFKSWLQENRSMRIAQSGAGDSPA